MIKKALYLLTILLSLNVSANEKVSLQLQWKHQFQFAGYYMAKEKGFYEDVGLEVDIRELDDKNSPIEAVSKNTATYGVGRSTLIIDKSNNIHIKLLSAIFQSSPLVVIALKSSNINTIQEFIGKKIMISAQESDTVALQAMIKQSDVYIGDMKILRHSFDINDLIGGKTDLISAYTSSLPFLLKQKGLKYNLFDPKDYGFDFYSDILFTSDDEVNND
nr:ABC transporter substrate-binding protein [Sulfurimonas sp.]